MSEVRALREELARLHRGRGVRYTPAMRERITRVAKAQRAAGRGFQSIGKELGIPHETVRRFLTMTKDGSACSMTPAFRPVAVEPTRAALVLVTADGHRVEGAAVADVVAIIRGLR